MAHTHSVKEYPKQIVSVAVLAAAAGAGIALLTSPKSGKENRQKISAQTMKLKGKFKRNTVTTAKKSIEVPKRVTRKAAQTSSKAKSSTTKVVRKTAKQATKDAKDLSDHIRKHGEP